MDGTFALVREGLRVMGTVGSPVFLTLLGVGLLVGILQAATQVNDAAVGFLPRLIAAALVLAWTGPWVLEQLARFLASAMTRMAQGAG